jgi:hypothetical protein
MSQKEKPDKKLNLSLKFITKIPKRIKQLLSSTILSPTTMADSRPPTPTPNKSTANGTKYARQIFKEAMILTFD